MNIHRVSELDALSEDAGGWGCTAELGRGLWMYLVRGGCFSRSRGVRSRCMFLSIPTLFKNGNTVDLQCCVSFWCTAKWLCTRTHTHTHTHTHTFFRFFSIIGYYEILSIVPCAVQRFLVYLLYVQQCVSADPKLIIYPSLTPFPYGNHEFVFCVCEPVSVL